MLNYRLRSHRIPSLQTGSSHVAALAFPDNQCIISTNSLPRASSWATPHPTTHHHPASPWVITRSWPACPNQAETTSKFLATVARDPFRRLSEPLSRSRKMPGAPASGKAAAKGPRAGPAALHSARGGAAAAAFALSTFPAPLGVPSLPICGAHARSERRARGGQAAAAAAAAGAARRRGAGRGERAARGRARARRPGRQRAGGERGEQPRGARAAAWRGPDARSPAATAAPPRP